MVSMRWAMPKIACRPALEPMVDTSIARAAAVGYWLLNWLTSSHTISPNTPPQIRAPRSTPRVTMRADASPGNRLVRTGWRTVIVSADIGGHLQAPGRLFGAVLGEEQLLQ